MQTESNTTNNGNLIKNNSYTEDDVFKFLNSFKDNIIKYQHYLYFVGTTNDNKALRQNIKSLHESVVSSFDSKENILKVFFEKILKEHIPNSPNSDQLARFLSFTISALSCLELTLQKFINLSNLFCFETKDNFIKLDLDGPVFEKAHTGPNELSSSDDFDKTELNNRLDMLRSIREEIEHMDTNLLRFNVESESNEFFHRFGGTRTEIKFVAIKMNDQKQNKKNKSQNNKSISKTTSSPSTSTKETSLFQNLKCNKRLITISFIVLLTLVVIGIICGLVFGLKG